MSPTCLFDDGVGECVQFWLLIEMFAAEGELFGVVLDMMSWANLFVS